jgi:hypothetical protein
MGRLHLGAFTALALTLAGQAGAAEITRVASRGEPGKPFEMHVTLRWDRLQESARITREVPTAPTPDNPAGGITDGDEMRYERSLNTVVPRVALGITEDVEFHLEWPYVLGDDRTWRFGLGANGVPSGGAYPTAVSTIEMNDVNADGLPCAVDVDLNIPGVQCPLFPVAPDTTVYHGGRAGDVKAGVAWGIFDDRKDPTKPFWLAGLDITFPTAARYDPAGERDFSSPLWASPNSVPGNPAPVGEKVWKWDLYTALSRRMGPIDPYVKGHLVIMSKSNGTYSNCEHAAELAGRANPEMNAQAVATCSAQGSKAGAKLPWIAGLTFGTELVPYENEAEQQRVAIDFRLFADYTSSQRFYNELTDASGKLHWTDDYMTMGGFFGLYLRASRFVTLQATASLSTSTAHWLTGETMGDDNPNFDWRYDAPGRRFRISEVSNFGMSFAGVLTF